MSSPPEIYTIPNFSFVSGVQKPIHVAYRQFNPTSTKGTVLIPTCFAGRIDTTLNFTSGALKDYHVIVVAMLSNGESSSPSNDPDFPKDYSLRYEDCISSQYILLTQHLKIISLSAVIGFSMAAQQAYYWAVLHGSGSQPFVQRAVAICGSAKTSGLNYAFLEGPIAALTTSFDYDHGKYREKGVKPMQGLRAFGRAYAAWLTSAEWFRRGLWTSFGAESLQKWLHPEESSWESWDAEDLLTLARMWQAGDVGKLVQGGDWKEALRGVTAKVLVMPCTTDQYFVVEEGEEEVKYLTRGRFEPIVSCFGHTAGGGANEEDTRWMDGKIAEFLEEP